MKILGKVKQNNGGERYPIRAEYMDKNSTIVPARMIMASPNLNN
jgi:hypothetical protein